MGIFRFQATTLIGDLELYIFVNIIHSLFIFGTKYAYDTGNQNTCITPDIQIVYTDNDIARMIGQ